MAGTTTARVPKAPPPLWAGWFRKAGRRAWQRVSEGETFSEAYAQLQSAVRELGEGEPWVIRGGVHPKDLAGGTGQFAKDRSRPKAKNQAWTKSQVEIVRREFGTRPAEELARSLGTTVHQLRRLAKKLGIQREYVKSKRE